MKVLLGAFAAGVIIIIGLILFPGGFTLFGTVDTTGLTPVTSAYVTAEPYLFMGIIGVCAYFALKSGKLNG